MRLPSPPDPLMTEAFRQIQAEDKQNVKIDRSTEFPDDVYLAAELLDNGGSVFNVKHPTFGAAGDGVTDDTSAIQAAINAAVAAEGKVFIPPGIYLISSTLTVTDTVTIQGASNVRHGASAGAVTTGGSVLYLADGANTDLLSVGNGGVNEFTHPMVYRLTLFGNRHNNTSGSCLNLAGTNMHPVVELCDISHAAEHGINCTSTTNGAELRANVIYFCGTNNINAASLADSRIVHSSIGRAGAQGISVGSGNNQLIGNHCWISGDRGIRVSSDGNQLIGNRCNTSQGAGIHIVGATKTLALANVCHDNGQDDTKTTNERAGMLVSGAVDSTTLVGNVLTGGDGGGGMQRRGISALDASIVHITLGLNTTSGDHGGGEIEVDASKVEFQFGPGGPVGQQGPLTAANGSTVDATYGTEERDVIQNLVTRVGEIETALTNLGLLST